MLASSRIFASTCFAALLVSGFVSGCHGPDGEDMIADDGETLAGESGTGSEAETNEPEVCDPPSPYMGGWDIGCCQDEVPAQNGWSPGAVYAGTIMPDWTFDTDQFGEAVRLYDFCHEAVYFEYVALW